MARKSAKKAPAKKPAAKKASRKPTPAKPGATKAVRVRMYCQGLGDCFLLSFPRQDSDGRFYVLIDCGVLQGAPNAGDRLEAVAQDLRKTTGGNIDLLIVTHEHWDHVAGFSFAQTVFEGIEFKAVWLSWAENPKDLDARRLKSELGKKRASIAKALQAAAFKMSDANADPLQKDLQSTRYVMDFFGPSVASRPNAGMSLGETMDWVRGKVQGAFCEPGECRNLPETYGVKAYILGPPRDPKLIRKMNPTGNQGYVAATASFSASLDWLGDQQTPLPPGPFDECFALSVEQAQLDPFFREHYGFANDPLGSGAPAWRRIDDEWLGSVGRFALQLDTAVNNTSLVIVFELPDGRTMLFPGDAQIGNWLSWRNVEFKDEAGKKLPVTSTDLLHRAVFYKVGHHGSHNATLKAGGLEDMTSGDLVAMIPTDEKFAATRKPPQDGWKMPFKDLYQALCEHTDYRVARADFNASKTEQFVNQTSGGLDFFRELTFSPEPLPGDKRMPLYVEYTLPNLK